MLCFPLALTVIQTLLNPFSKGFNVTPEGATSDRFTFNWQLAFPLVVLFCASALSLWINLGLYTMSGMAHADVPIDIVERFKGLGLGVFWNVYNLLMLSISLLILIDAPRPSQHEWFRLRRTVRLQIGQRQFWSITTVISEVGAKIVLTQKDFPDLLDPLPVEIELMEENLRLQGHVTGSDPLCRDTDQQHEFPSVQVTFDAPDSSQQRRLVELLFCRPGQWKSRCAPGELRSLWLLFGILLRPRVVFGRQTRIHEIAVTQS